MCVRWLLLYSVISQFNFLSHLGKTLKTQRSKPGFWDWGKASKTARPQNLRRCSLSDADPALKGLFKFCTVGSSLPRRNVSSESHKWPTSLIWILGSHKTWVRGCAFWCREGKVDCLRDRRSRFQSPFHHFCHIPTNLRHHWLYKIPSLYVPLRKNAH